MLIAAFSWLAGAGTWLAMAAAAALVVTGGILRRSIPIAAVFAVVAALCLALLAQQRAKNDYRIAASEAKMQAAEMAAAYDRARIVAAQELAFLSEQFRATEENLNSKFKQSDEEKDTQIAAAGAVADGLRKRLRNAEARARANAGGVPRGAATASGAAPAGDGDGAELPAAIGGEDVDEAERADRIRAEYVGLVAKYEAARLELARLKAEQEARKTVP